MKFIIGVIFGIVIATVGVNATMSAIAHMLDRGVQTIQTQSKELSQ